MPSSFAASESDVYSTNSKSPTSKGVNHQHRAICSAISPASFLHGRATVVLRTSPMPSCPTRTAILLLICACLHGAKLPVKHYSTADGLPRDTIHCILRDREGYLWFATGEGLARFDGYDFQSFRVKDDLPDRDVRAVSESEDGSFFVSTGGGAARFYPERPDPARRFERYLLPDTAKGRSVKVSLEDRGILWIGTDAGLYTVRGGVGARAELFPLGQPGAGEPQINALVRDPARNLWVGTSAGLLLIESGERKQGRPIDFTLAAGLPSADIVSLLVDGEILWIGTSRGLVKMPLRVDASSGGRFTLEGEVLFRGIETRSILRARDGSLWVGAGNVVGRLAPGAAQFKVLGEREGFANGDATAIAEDARGDIWVGYDGAGAVRLSSTGAFTTYDDSDGLPEAQISTLTLSRTGSPLVATWSRPGIAAWRFEKDRFERLPISGDAELYPEFWRPWHEALLVDRSGAWWTGSEHGLQRFLPRGRAGTGKLQTTYRTGEGPSNNEVAHVFQDSKGNIWYSTLPIVAYPGPGVRSGLGMLDRSTGALRTFTEADGLPALNSVAILYIAEDHAGQIWIGLYRSGVARFRNGRFQVLTAAEGIPTGGIRFIFEDSHHRLWLASGRGGLGRVDEPAAEKLKVVHYNTGNGLSSDEIQTITEDRFGRIYAGTGLGVDRIDPSSGRIVHYTTANGLAPGEVQDSVRDQAGDLWFGTYKAVSRLHPEADRPEQELAARIAAIRVNGRLVQANLRARAVGIQDIPPGSNSIEIEYLALAVSGTENVRYQHRLQGADEEWSEPNFTRSAHYDNLRPGLYVFEARSLDPAPGQTASVQFFVQSFFWDRWWFWAGCAVLVLGVAYALHLYRLSNLLRIQEMRTRLSRDLHDDIGSSLSKIAIMSEVARRDTGGSAALDRIAETSREVLDAVGDLVWATSPSAERFEDLIHRMRAFATQLLEAQGADFTLQVTGVPLEKTLSPEWVRQVYLIFKEAVNNAAKHSGCTCARAELRRRTRL